MSLHDSSGVDIGMLHQKACQLHDYDALKSLLQSREVRVKPKTRFEETQVFDIYISAMQNNREDVCKLLIHKGVDAGMRHGELMRAAILQNRVDLVDFLQARGAACCLTEKEWTRFDFAEQMHKKRREEIRKFWKACFLAAVRK